jgi:predicted  nucleic acid-binding Zn-ribbon protein
MDKEQVEAMCSPVHKAIDKELWATDNIIKWDETEAISLIDLRKFFDDFLTQAANNFEFAAKAVQGLDDGIKSYKKQVDVLSGQIKNLNNRIFSHESAKAVMVAELEKKRATLRVFQQLFNELPKPKQKDC